MTLPRVPGSDKALLLDVLNVLSPQLVETATGKHPSTLYKASNESARIGVHLRDAAALDGALIVQGFGPLLLPWAARHRDDTVLRLGGPRVHDPMDPLHRLTELVSSIGNVADEIRAAVDARGVAGADIVQREADRVRAAIDETRRALEHLEKDVNALTKPCTSSGATRPLSVVGGAP